MRSSFCIRLSRESKEWFPTEDLSLLTQSIQPAAMPKTSPKTNHPENKQSHPLSASKVSITAHPVARTAGLLNKGNTCYANAILQSLNVLPQFWTVLSSVSSCKSKLGSACFTFFTPIINFYRSF